MNIGRLHIVLLLTGCLVTRVTIAQQETKPNRPENGAQQPVAAPVQDEDPVTVFVPKAPRDDRDRDQITAASLFAHGRLLFQQQKFVTDFLNSNTPYRGLLLYHGLGSGKSGASIATSEGFHNKLRAIVGYILFLVPKKIRNINPINLKP